MMKFAVAVILFLSLVCSASFAAPPVDTKDTFIYVGTYTDKPTQSKGIYVYRLQTTHLDVSQNITFVPMGVAAETPNPSYLTADLKRRLIFAVNELDTYDGKPTGSVTSFAVKPDATLQAINTQPSGGAGPCHCVLDGTGKWLAVSNYNGGSFELLPVAADGKLGEPTTVIKFDGAAKTHCAAFSPDNKFLFVCCLGLDKVMSYKFDAATGKVVPNDPAFAQVKQGAGPRHIVFRQDGQFAYVINELNSTIIAFSCDARAGKLSEIQTISTLAPVDADTPNTAAEIAIHPNQKFLYASNRGNESIVLFEIDPRKGTLTFVESQYTGGKTPRHFGIQPNAKHMAIINQNTDQVLASRIDAGNGRLKPSGVFATCPTPSCAIFLPPPNELTMTGGVTGD